MEDHLKNKNRLEKEWEALCAYQAEPSSSLVAQREENVPKNRCPAVLTCTYSARAPGGQGAVSDPWGQAAPACSLIIFLLTSSRAGKPLPAPPHRAPCLPADCPLTLRRVYSSPL